MPESVANSSPKSRVLVADDEQVIANTLAIILNQAGFEARAVYSGEKAVESLDSFQPDMLISDVIMTGMTGIEAAIATRRKMPNCKILLTLHEYLAICHHFGQMVTTRHRNLCYQSSPVRCQQCFPEFDKSDFFLRKRYVNADS